MRDFETIENSRLEIMKCGICLETLSAPVALDCGHVFDDGCIRSWTGTSHTRQCPFCKKAVQRIMSLYLDSVDEESGPTRQGHSAGLERRDLVAQLRAEKQELEGRLRDKDAAALEAEQSKWKLLNDQEAQHNLVVCGLREHFHRLQEDIHQLRSREAHLQHALASMTHMHSIAQSDLRGMAKMRNCVEVQRLMAEYDLEPMTGLDPRALVAQLRVLRDELRETQEQLHVERLAKQQLEREGLQQPFRRAVVDRTARTDHSRPGHMTADSNAAKGVSVSAARGAAFPEDDDDAIVELQPVQPARGAAFTAGRLAVKRPSYSSVSDGMGGRAKVIRTSTGLQLL